MPEEKNHDIVRRHPKRCSKIYICVKSTITSGATQSISLNAFRKIDSIVKMRTVVIGSNLLRKHAKKLVMIKSSLIFLFLFLLD